MPDDPKTPEDVAALLSHTELNQYKVFQSERRPSGTASQGATTPAQGFLPAPQPEPGKLEFVRQQPPRWTLLQDLGHEANRVMPANDGELRVPTYAVFSTGGGTGKTTVAATLARALSQGGENVLMVHGALQPSAPLHFGAQQSQAGRLRTFVPPQRKQGTVHLLSHQFDELAPQPEEGGDWLAREVGALQGEIQRCIIEISSPRGQELAMLQKAHVCLVVLTPDINSVMALGQFNKLLEPRPGMRAPSVHFLINKFDPTSAFHGEVRQNLRMLGARLLPFCIRRNDSVTESLAAGMTVLDYAPGSAPAEDFLRLAQWAREATTAFRAQGAL